MLVYFHIFKVGISEFAFGEK